MSRRRFAAYLTGAVLVLTLPRLWHHELWRDEAWLWLVATSSDSFPALVGALERSGQGYAFPILAWLVGRVTESPLGLQCLNLAIVCAGTWLLARHSPFRRAECVLLVFGYYLGYEYAVLSRHYALGIALAFLACAALRAGRPVVAAVTLALLCQTTVYGIIVAAVVAVGGLALLRTNMARPAPRVLVLCALTVAAGAVAGVVQVIPEEGTAFAVGWRFSWDGTTALEVLQLPWRAMLPLASLQVDAWNTDPLATSPVWRSAAGFAALMLALSIASVRRLALLLFAFGAAGLLAFAYVKYVGSMRHHGHLFVVLLVALWMAGGFNGGDDPVRRRGWRERAFVVVLIVHLGTGIAISVLDLVRPFSNGARAAATIRAAGLDRLPMVGYREPPAASVALYLRAPLYAPSRDRFTTHTDWGPEQRDVGLPALHCAAIRVALDAGSDVVLVMNGELPPWPGVVREGAVTGAMVASENYYVYRLLHQRASTAPPPGCAVAGASG